MISNNLFYLFLVPLKLYNSNSFVLTACVFIYFMKNKTQLFFMKKTQRKAIYLIWKKQSIRASLFLLFFVKSNSSPIASKFVSSIIVTSNLLKYYQFFKNNNMFNYLNIVNLQISNVNLSTYKITNPYKVNLRFHTFFNLFQFNNFIL